MQDRNELRNSSDGQTRPYDELPLLMLVAKLDSALTELEHAKLAVEEIRAAQQRRVQEAVDDARFLLGKPEGTVTVKIEGCEVKATKPKKVAWEQEMLISAMAELAPEYGDDFVKMEFSITERAWEALPPAAKKRLSVARTLTHGLEKISVSPEEVPF